MHTSYWKNACRQCYYTGGMLHKTSLLFYLCFIFLPVSRILIRIEKLSECIQVYWAQYELVHPYRTQVHVSGTAVSRSGLVTHEWGVRNSVSTAFSHREGITVTRVAVQSQRPGSTHREVTYLQLGSPAICVCMWLCACI